MRKMLLAAGVVAIASGTAGAQTWVEVGDAGALLPGQITLGFGALTTIRGNLSTADLEDLYCIRIDNPAGFSASTVGTTLFDTQLSLFNANGVGVTFNDDHVGGTTLQSRITGQFVPAPGIYFLAISPYDRDPQSGGADIWLDTPFRSERAPDGAGAAGALTGWAGVPGFGVTPGAYSIQLTGASYHDIPAPGAVALFGLAGAAAARRRRV